MIQSSSLPNAPMALWVAFIKLFDFILVHKPGKTFTTPDGLSHCLSLTEDDEWLPCVVFDEMAEPMHPVKNKQGTEDLEVHFCLIFLPMMHPDGHKEASYFWDKYRYW